MGDHTPQTVDELRQRLSPRNLKRVEDLDQFGEQLHREIAAVLRIPLDLLDRNRQDDVRLVIGELGRCRGLIADCERYHDQADGFIRPDDLRVHDRRVYEYLRGGFSLLYRIDAHADALRQLVAEYTAWLKAVARDCGVIAPAQDLDDDKLLELWHAVPPAEEIKPPSTPTPAAVEPRPVDDQPQFVDLDDVGQGDRLQGNTLYWRGAPHPLSRGHVAVLVKLFWDRKRPISYDGLYGYGLPWDTSADVTNDAVRRAVERVNQQLPAGFTWKLAFDHGRRLLRRVDS